MRRASPVDQPMLALGKLKQDYLVGGTVRVYPTPNSSRQMFMGCLIPPEGQNTQISSASIAHLGKTPRQIYI